MASNDKVIQCMLELLGKLIENQTENASLLGDIKSALVELRKESDSILQNLRDKLPEEISREQDMLYERFSILADKIEASNQKLANNIAMYDDKYENLKVSIDNNTEILNTHSSVLQSIQTFLSTKDTVKEQINNKLDVVTGFIESLRSKKVWIAVIVGAITALAGAFSGVVNAYKAIAPAEVKNVSPLEINK